MDTDMYMLDYSFLSLLTANDHIVSIGPTVPPQFVWRSSSTSYKSNEQDNYDLPVSKTYID